MRIFVKAKPSARENKVEKIYEGHYVVSVKDPPVRGRANTAIVKVIAQHFGVPSTSVRIVSGHTAKNKVIEIKL